MWTPPADEWDAIALNYTSGTTGEPKGVVYHHRGAYLNALSNILEWDMPKHAVYLWTLPLFHCNGWCFPWTIAARAGVNVCLRKFDAKTVFDLIRDERVTHYCGAPIVQGALANAPAQWREGIEHRVSTMVAGAPPSPAMIAHMKAIGFDLTHVYGLTEVYGPASVCAKQQQWDALDDDACARLNARQGVRYHLQAAAAVLDPDTLEPVPCDGETLGEVMFRGNICMKGYLKNPRATDEAFRGGWFHTGDLGVLMPDGYFRITDRSKDIIISGGENISSIEVEDALYRHPAVSVAAVVAMPDAKWGEVPCAFIELKEGAQVSAEQIVEHCRAWLAGFKLPKAVVFCELPKTATGKIQKFELRARVKPNPAAKDS
jgi:fatty-acyl-CoA synthase